MPAPEGVPRKSKGSVLLLNASAEELVFILDIIADGGAIKFASFVGAAEGAVELKSNKVLIFEVDDAATLLDGKFVKSPKRSFFVLPAAEVWLYPFPLEVVPRSLLPPKSKSFLVVPG